MYGGEPRAAAGDIHHAEIRPSLTMARKLQPLSQILSICGRRAGHFFVFYNLLPVCIVFLHLGVNTSLMRQPGNSAFDNPKSSQYRTT